MIALGLAACAPQGNERDRPHRAGDKPDLPQLNTRVPAGHTAWSNDSLATLFVHLTHDLEWGARRPHLVRYEAPIRVGLTGPGSRQYAGFLDRFLGNLRAQTGIDIARGAAPQNLLIRFVPGSAFRAKVPQHFCVVAPGRLDWPTFRKDPVRFGTRAFETARNLDAMTVFIPDNAEPWLVRVCLIEEITQGLGPANDLYGLGPSIFNDDAAYVWPTRLDYLMLRVLYQPEMRTGLNRQATRARAREVLARLNPSGAGAPPLPRLRIREMRDWAEILRDAFDRSASIGTRRGAARKAVDLARTRAPRSAFHCHSLTVLARLYRQSPKDERALLNRAMTVCTSAHGTDVRSAKLVLEKARATFRAGQPGAAYGLTEKLEQRLAGFALEERLVALYALQAASLRAIQQPREAAEIRRKAIEWGSYALGRDHPDVLRLTNN
ncbi:MAG: DUF2927 domain-containing protein [Paracoccaceae bacterium]